MSQVLVLDAAQRPLDPVHPGYARRLLTRRQAAVWRRYPFTIILKVGKPADLVTPLHLKIDPGSQTTGVAILNDSTGAVVWAAEVTHQGEQIRKRLASRCTARRSRRARKTRYRPARSRNRRRSSGWLSPSLESRLSHVLTWVARLRRLCFIATLSQELEKFDTQALQHPEIQGVEYQQGALAGYEVREYLLEKWQRRCAYCGAKGVPLQIEHIVPKARGGSDRVSNLTLACELCNQGKGTQTAAEFGYAEVQAQAKKPLKDAAALNATRWAFYKRLVCTGLPIEIGTGGRTKYNRIRHGLPKSHWLDAACVGASTPDRLQVAGIRPLLICATGWQCRQMCRVDRYGFPRTSAKRHSRVQGFQTGDIVRAVVPTGKRAGTYVGRVAVRATGFFNIATSTGTVQGVAARFCRVIHRQDGYSYEDGGCGFLPL